MTEAQWRWSTEFERIRAEHRAASERASDRLDRAAMLPAAVVGMPDHAEDANVTDRAVSYVLPANLDMRTTPVQPESEYDEEPPRTSWLV
ncbi:hypothetical protein [Rhodococcoides yunnanense]|uniref:hypothetical protein n=1 Tax=Rhodococcoides yunnanense TaxID=278209 RepID=UPI000932F8E1|nr:hypothetical protein [Rhodococcus yunnanensis]